MSKRRCGRCIGGVVAFTLMGCADAATPTEPLLVTLSANNVVLTFQDTRPQLLWVCTYQLTVEVKGSTRGSSIDLVRHDREIDASGQVTSIVDQDPAQLRASFGTSSVQTGFRASANESITSTAPFVATIRHTLHYRDAGQRTDSVRASARCQTQTS